MQHLLRFFSLNPFSYSIPHIILWGHYQNRIFHFRICLLFLYAKVKTVQTWNPLPVSHAESHVHTYSCITICVGVCHCLCEKLIVLICMQHKAARWGGADLAHAPSHWFELSNAFINYDESPRHFTSNQRPLRGTQIWSLLTKWFSWPMLCQPVIELATWWFGYC